MLIGTNYYTAIGRPILNNAKVIYLYIRYLLQLNNNA